MSAPKRVRIGPTGKVPAGAIDISRRTVFRSPWNIVWVRKWLRSVNVEPHETLRKTREVCVANYRLWLVSGLPVSMPAQRAKLLGRLDDLRGKDLACFCPLGEPCHGDVLLELANRRPLFAENDMEAFEWLQKITSIADGRQPI